MFGWGSVCGDGGEWMKGLGFTNPMGTGKCWTCLCFGCSGVGGEWVGVMSGFYV